MRNENILKLINDKLGTLFEKDARRVNSGIPSSNEKLELFVKNEYKIEGKLKTLLQKRNKKIIDSFF